MKQKNAWLFAFILVTACNQKDSEHSVAIVGLDKSGSSQVQFMDKNILSEKWGSMMSGITNQVTDTLDKIEKPEMTSWELSRVTVGLKLETEFAVLEDTLEIENEGDIELRFQKR